MAHFRLQGLGLLPPRCRPAALLCSPVLLFLNLVHSWVLVASNAVLQLLPYFVHALAPRYDSGLCLRFPLPCLSSEVRASASELDGAPSKNQKKYLLRYVLY